MIKNIGTALIMIALITTISYLDKPAPSYLPPLFAIILEWIVGFVLYFIGSFLERKK